nr:MAG TPA: hypothetical protein [Caudoviricetes sp.]
MFIIYSLLHFLRCMSAVLCLICSFTPANSKKAK